MPRRYLLLALLAFPAFAEDDVLRVEEDYKSVKTIAIENDIFAGTDSNYTNGVRFAYLSAESNIPRWMDKAADAFPLFSHEGHKRWHFELGQSMFTPADITIQDLQPNDRPYAGWLYGSVGMLSDTGYRLDNLQLTLGMVGPASGAGRTQKFVHSVIDTTYPLGWDNQLHNEPGIVLSYERKWRGLFEFSPKGWGADITPSVGGSVGNIYTHASVGTVVRFGYDLPSDYGPPLIRPSLPGSDFFVPDKNIGWYLFAGLEGRAVGRNIFLDGNTFEDSHSVDKRNLVGGAQVGLALTIHDTRVAYTHNFRTKEFHGQPDRNDFGALTVSWRY